jgi:hypothetical protein
MTMAPKYPKISIAGIVPCFDDTNMGKTHTIVRDAGYICRFA